jgi:hypothetical protein
MAPLPLEELEQLTVDRALAPFPLPSAVVKTVAKGIMGG